MSKQSSLAPSRQHQSSSDWLTTAPGLPARSLACASLAAPALLAAGVYWLHSVPQPARPQQRPAGVVDVRLLTSAIRAEKGMQASLSDGEPRPSALPVEAPEPAPSPSGGMAKPISQSTHRSGEAVAPAAPAVAPSRSAGKPSAAAFQRALLAHIARFRRYPEQARREGLRGVVHVLFAMRRDGVLTSVSIRRSSGQPLLDAAAAEAIRSAQPLPKIPPDLPDHLTILAPVSFEIPEATLQAR